MKQHGRKERRIRQNGFRDFAELKAHYVGAHVEMCVLHSWLCTFGIIIKFELWQIAGDFDLCNNEQQILLYVAL